MSLTLQEDVSHREVKELDFSINAALQALPTHLKQFAVDQRYDHYTPIDHAVWRYIMRQNRFFLKEYAHKLYFKGLLETGISFERIPRIEEMNQILAGIGWGAVAVDGFIPPAAFMEFQAYKVLVIACDMRQIHHIEYTPAPDIVHEAAGHAPIIVDREYADYLQRFGEVGAKAMSSRKDFELYEAIRHLSILKELPNVDPAELLAAENLVGERQAQLGEPSEMALLSRLHWWTVEYGLIGTLEKPKIYGAGLLSSIGESVTCLEPNVKKLPYSVDAANYPFDITTRQPQLFVVRDFSHLSAVLEEFASSMAFRTGGISGIRKAIDCQNTATCVYSSGLQVSGIFSEIVTDSAGAPAYVTTKGNTALAFRNKELIGHGIEYHADGFGSPVGLIKGFEKSPELLSDADLRRLGIREGKSANLEFKSGVKVRGVVQKIERCEGRVMLISWTECSVEFEGRLLFQPGWGSYDMAVGESLVSVFNGAADKDAYHQVALIPKERTIKRPPALEERRLQELYRTVREIRESRIGYDEFEALWREAQRTYPTDWLLSMEILELLRTNDLDASLQGEIAAVLRQREKLEPELATLIDWGFRLIDYHKAELEHAA